MVSCQDTPVSLQYVATRDGNNREKMKVLESQNSVLTNYEVYQHLLEHQNRHKGRHRRGPGNLNTLVTEVINYLRTPPSPISKEGKSGDCDPSVISRLFEKLAAANLNQDLAKGEILMIVNLRPSSNAVLSTIIEDMEDRFSEEEQSTILDIIAEVLGRPILSEAEPDVQHRDSTRVIESGA
ncbi:hypothetical protein VTK73DRAFT_4183 [Phialemonium thermophilum]|uniref:DNA-directed RNA polymerase III subunit RPC9 n=1 Tax=Phialemonium thermophilum TaxID=223376 RepID=A0ABR3WUW4_9PEZI